MPESLTCTICGENTFFVLANGNLECTECGQEYGNVDELKEAQ